MAVFSVNFARWTEDAPVSVAEIMRDGQVKSYPDLKAIYAKLAAAAGKTAKVAFTALSRKLVVLANALLKADREWAPKCP
jgi:hypothetical protein